MAIIPLSEPILTPAAGGVHSDGTSSSSQGRGRSESQGSGCSDHAPPIRGPLESRSSSEAWAQRVMSHAAVVQACDGWVLDICLDYFGTHNPFSFQLASRGGERLAAALQAAAAGAHSTPRGGLNQVSGDFEATADVTETRLEAARWLEEGLIHVLLGSTLSTCAEGLFPVLFERLLSLYPTPAEGRALLSMLATEAAVARALKTPEGDAWLEVAVAMVSCASLPDAPRTTA